MTGVIVVPPLGRSAWPSLAAHLLQGCAARAGFKVRVLYGNLLFAARVGEHRYDPLCTPPISVLLGENLFARAAFGLPPLRDRMPRTSLGRRFKLSWDDLYEFENQTEDWADETAARALADNPDWVGITSTVEQSVAGLAVLARVKLRSPSTITLMGGGNFEGEMADGYATLAQAADYIFSGESEDSFTAFLKELAQGKRPSERIVRGRPLKDMNSLPTPDFQEFFDQRAACGLDRPPRGLRLNYQSSRGCWWGEKQHCTFCGLNGEGMAFRAMSPDRILSDLEDMAARHNLPLILMNDSIMPREYFQTLLPRLAERRSHLRLFFEQKANLSLEEVAALKEAGVIGIQPGIEALSTALLKRMRKGTSAHSNIRLLRNSRAAGMRLNWYLLYGFPGDLEADYREVTDLLPLIHHLHPPLGPFPVIIDRFSPYHARPAEFGLSRLRPLPAYASAFPPGADLDRLAYHFEADFVSESAAGGPLIERFIERAWAWVDRWSTVPPVLQIEPWNHGWLLRDTRGLPGLFELEPVTRDQVRAALDVDASEEARAWALERKAAVMLEGRYTPLATASVPHLLALRARHENRACADREAVTARS